MVEVTAEGYKSVSANETQGAAIRCWRGSQGDTGNMQIYSNLYEKNPPKERQRGEMSLIISSIIQKHVFFICIRREAD